jgi:hypothetical protein
LSDIFVVEVNGDQLQFFNPHQLTMLWLAPSDGDTDMPKPYLRDLRADAEALQREAGEWVIAGVETSACTAAP